ncbi:Uma2 family endonuclease [Nocardiopsis suaedae]|uniref:Uma2 family endonuclease n=1 Tax=Nocardiopsis suaedae TaxID=3018444 RepID=A0ABT4TH95_9ACTN|nr:Uma2 family endonuclease [Nocardiopsis suaedae]MDA2803765.1 Uma2 family endonuclease [Nocardiopsis suaedae]
MSRLPIEWEIFPTVGVQVPHVEKLYVPDLCVIPSDVFPTAKPPVEGAEALLVVEITSPSNVEHDRKKKRWAYAHAPVSLYLLVDAYDVSGPSVTLFSHPNNGDYGTITKERFGAQVHLPEPFGFDLETGAFPKE